MKQLWDHQAAAAGAAQAALAAGGRAIIVAAAGTGKTITAAGEPGAGQAAVCCPVCGCQPARPHPGLPAGRTGLLLAWLAGNYCRSGLRVAEMAAAAGVSIRVLQATCKRDFGRTPLQLLADVRLHHAHLRLTGLGPAPRSVAQVARSAGFTRVARFSAAYRRRYGTPPAITARITPAAPVQEHDER